MDSFEWNKIIGAILGTLLFVFIVKEVASIVFHDEEEPEELAYKIEIPEDSTQAAAEKKPEVVDFGVLLREASAERGESVAKRCLQCHTFEKGGPNKTGPNLWGILGADIAAHDGFNYSHALSSMDGQWTYERVYKFVGAPSRYIPGTNMNFAGLRQQGARIDLLAYLRKMDDDPPPIPEPLPVEQEDEAAGAPEGDEAAGEEASQDGSTSAEESDASEEGTAEEEQPAGEDAAPGDEETSDNGEPSQDENAGDGDGGPEEKGAPEEDTSGQDGEGGF